MKLFHQVLFERRVRIRDHGDVESRGTVSLSSSSHLPATPSAHPTEVPVRFPSGCARLVASPVRSGSPIAMPTIGIVLSRVLRSDGSLCAKGDQHIDLVRRSPRPSAQESDRPGRLPSAVYDCKVLAFNVAQFAQTSPEGVETVHGRGRRLRIDQADARNLLSRLRSTTQQREKQKPGQIQVPSEERRALGHWIIFITINA